MGRVMGEKVDEREKEEAQRICVQERRVPPARASASAANAAIVTSTASKGRALGNSIFVCLALTPLVLFSKSNRTREPSAATLLMW